MLKFIHNKCLLTKEIILGFILSEIKHAWNFKVKDILNYIGLHVMELIFFLKYT